MIKWMATVQRKDIKNRKQITQESKTSGKAVK